MDTSPGTDCCRRLFLLSEAAVEQIPQARVAAVQPVFLRRAEPGPPGGVPPALIYSGASTSRGSYPDGSFSLVDHVLDVVVDIIFFTELSGERQTCEVLQPVPVNRINIKPNNEGRKEPNVGQKGKADEDTFAVLVRGSKGEIRQEGEGQQQAAEEAKDAGDVIDPGQEAAEEEEEHDGEQLQKGLPRLLQHLPGLEELDEQASKEPKLGTCWTHLQGESGGFNTPTALKVGSVGPQGM